VTTVPTVLILDASGSMTTSDAPGPRIDAAKKAAQGLVDKLPDDATIGLTTYGTGTEPSEAEQAAGCLDVTTLIPLGRLDRGRMAQQIAGLTPSGYTPISLSLQRVADQLPADNSAQAIVLVSDGEDTCGTPPCDIAAALKQTHPGLNISTVGFKTDGPASEQLACIAKATGGLFVGADNADQLAARLIAVQNINQAKKSLTGDGIDDIKLGQSLDNIRKAHPDFPDGSRTGKVVVVYVDCDFGFVDGILDSITPHDGGRTIDGVTVGTDMARVTDLYGDPLSVEPGKHVAVYRADPGNKESAAGYRIDVDQFAQNGGRVTGFVKTIVLCRCASHAAAEPTLGRANFHEYAENFGTVEPDYFSTASTASSTVRDIRWESWGTERAIGRGLTYGGVDNPNVDIIVVALDLGECDGHPAYRKLAYPDDPNVIDPNNAADICP
jgi:Ca-activated chloride channel family protein